MELTCMSAALFVVFENPPCFKKKVWQLPVAALAW